MGEKCLMRQISSRIRLPLNSKDLLHAANLRHGTDGFTSPPKEGMLKIFSPLKIRRLRSGLNPRTWVPKASTLPLDHRSRSDTYSPHLISILILSSHLLLVFQLVYFLHAFTRIFFTYAENSNFIVHEQVLIKFSICSPI